MKKSAIQNIFILCILQINLLAVQKPNILLISIDTWRYDRLSFCNKKFVQTPNIDKIAKKGVVFTRAFAHNPLTLPSHANILTGTTSPYHGISDNNRFKLNERFLTLAEYLKQFKYKTAAFVGSFVLSQYFGLNQGFDFYFEPIKKDTFIAEEVVTPVLNWLKSRNEKWFCFVHVWDPHTPYDPPSPYKKKYKDDPYSGEVAYVDSQLGRLFSFLEKNQMFNNTIIIITGDHGESLGEHGEYEHGYFSYNSTIHIPLILFYKKITAKKIKNYVSHVDIFPTICDILHLKTPAHLQGSSLIPLIKNGKRENRIIYFESKAAYHSKGWAPLEGFIFKKKKFIHLPIKELYDLEKDYHETRNIISRVPITKLNRTLKELKKKLSGKYHHHSKIKLSREAIQKLRTFGYLSGFKQQKKSHFTKKDDLKVLLPLQNQLREARNLVKKFKYKQAIAIHKQVIQKRPDSISSYIHLSEIYQKLNQPDKGLEIIGVGLKIKPDNLELKSRLAIMYTEVNKIDSAIVILKQVLQKEDFNAENWNYLGVAYYKKRKYQKAMEAYQKSLELDPHYGLVYNNIGSLYLSLFLKNKNQPLLKKAVENFKRAIELDPKLASAFNGLGAAYKFTGEKVKAINNWKKALHLNPEFINVYFNLGITLIEMGRNQEAHEILLKCKNRYFPRLKLKDQNRLNRLIAKAQQ